MVSLPTSPPKWTKSCVWLFGFRVGFCASGFEFDACQTEIERAKPRIRSTSNINPRNMFSWEDVPRLRLHRGGGLVPVFRTGARCAGPHSLHCNHSGLSGGYLIYLGILAKIIFVYSSVVGDIRLWVGPRILASSLLVRPHQVDIHVGRAQYMFLDTPVLT